MASDDPPFGEWTSARTLATGVSHGLRRLGVGDNADLPLAAYGSASEAHFGFPLSGFLPLDAPAARQVT